MGDIQTVAFIGLGKMGAAMARNILKAGFPLTVYNRTPDRMRPLVAAGAQGAASPKDAALAADVVLTSLMDDQSVLDVVVRPDGILAGLKRGGIHIGATTVSPRLATHLATLHSAHHSHYVAAPVLGRPEAAETAQLVGLVAGEPEVIERCGRLFEAYTTRTMNLGREQPVANSLKLAINYVLASAVELMGQVYAFGERSGIDLAVLEGIFHMMFGHPGLQGYATRIRTRDFDAAGFDLIAGLKDVQLILDAAVDTRVALPYASTIRDKLLTALAHGMEHRDWSAIYDVTRMNAGLA